MARPKGTTGIKHVKGLKEISIKDLKKIEYMGFVNPIDDLWVDRTGAVIRIKEKDNKYYEGNLSPKKDRSGYYKVGCTSRKGAITIHELVMLAFVGPRPEGKQIDHRDRNKANNKLENLRYVTPKENMENVDKAKHHRYYGRYMLDTKTFIDNEGNRIKMEPEEYLKKLKAEKRYFAYYKFFNKIR